ncbi:hypothetical protein HGRIS_014176 [Hohenbuehelia grisea]|uniref:Uncharacterized protein n=1 Tax=Hohenbuehelia grisea TaxID=104357 RepID=A0ABR3JUN7_9AGAR
MSTVQKPPFRIPSNADHERISALFLGPKAENFGLLRECFIEVLDKQRAVRTKYFPEDKAYITPQIKQSEAYEKQKKKLIDSLDGLTNLLNKHSIPFFSPRYSAHMCTDMSMPAILGYISTMLFNPNNVAFEASPITTHLELRVGQQLCDMFGYNTNKKLIGLPLGWGHVACDGTIANLEAIW